ncbi:MAG: isoprenyl transferase [Verrucomicrobiae bacterium]|nr:isoprenyl transferase [Verrucomicrobiae bacterium]
MKTPPALHELERIPRHVAVIMDGNGRWARQRLLPRIEGHRRGIESVRAVVRAAGELGIEYLTLYAFSKENWRRPKMEIAALMRLLERFLREEIGELNENKVRLKTIGARDDLPPRVLSQLRKTEAATAKNSGLTLILALSYGARDEILRAVRRVAADAVAGRLSPDAVDEIAFAARLDTAGVPDPDLLIRTSGELRVSNFLLWQISYAEFVISPALWPDFRREHFLEALREFANRRRRFGGVDPVSRKA